MSEHRTIALSVSDVEAPDVVLARVHTSMPANGQLLQLQVLATYADAPDRIVHNTIHFLPWDTIESIAAYVAGDGSDAQRVALADGIREGRRK